MTPDLRLQVRIMALAYGLRNFYQPGKRDRAARWFSLADRYKEVQP